MVACINTVAFHGVDVQNVDVQVQISNGLPALTIVKPINPDTINKILILCLLTLLIFFSPTHAMAKEPLKNAEQSGQVISENKETADDRIADYTLWLMVFTAILAAATIGLGIAAIRTDKTARISAEAAKKSADILAQSESAVLHSVMDRDSFDKIEELMRGSKMYNNSPSMGDSLINVTGGISYRIKNYGKTPGIVKKISHAIIISGSLPAEPVYPPKDIVYRCPLLSAGSDGGEHYVCEFSEFSEPVTMKETNALLAGEKSIWFYGCVLFDDIFGAPHEHRYVWRYSDGTFHQYYENEKYHKNK